MTGERRVRNGDKMQTTLQEEKGGNEEIRASPPPFFILFFSFFLFYIFFLFSQMNKLTTISDDAMYARRLVVREHLWSAAVMVS